jgi:hypothetical protein
MRLLLLREVLDNDFLEVKVLMANGPPAQNTVGWMPRPQIRLY